jgi:uncharacterized protein
MIMVRFACLAALFVATAAAALGAPTDQKIIVVSGYAEMSAVPDKATITIGVVTTDKVVVKALEQNNAEMQRVIAAVKALGVPDTDMQTSTFSIAAQHPKIKDAPYMDDETITLGYVVANQITINTTDIGKVAGIIDAAVKAGANSSNSVDFDVKNRSVFEDQVLANAVRDARHNAETMAEVEHAVVGKMVSMTNSSGYGYDFGFGAPAMAMARAPIGIPILPGQITLRAVVTVTYAIE